MVAAAPAQVRRTEQQARIEFLITAVAELGDARFLRNGKSYDAVMAAAHLRRKLAHAGARVQTAEQFIRLCATASWLGRQPYRIRFKDGRELSTAVYLEARLRAHDQRFSD